MKIAFAKRESTLISTAKKYVPAKDERALAKGKNQYLFDFST
jgi:hypothetical protein